MKLFFIIIYNIMVIAIIIVGLSGLSSANTAVGEVKKLVDNIKLPERGIILDTGINSIATFQQATLWDSENTNKEQAEKDKVKLKQLTTDILNHASFEKMFEGIEITIKQIQKKIDKVETLSIENFLDLISDKDQLNNIENELGMDLKLSSIFNNEKTINPYIEVLLEQYVRGFLMCLALLKERISIIYTREGFDKFEHLVIEELESFLEEHLIQLDRTFTSGPNSFFDPNEKNYNDCTNNISEFIKNIIHIVQKFIFNLFLILIKFRISIKKLKKNIIFLVKYSKLIKRIIDAYKNKLCYILYNKLVTLNLLIQIAIKQLQNFPKSEISIYGFVEQQLKNSDIKIK